MPTGWAPSPSGAIYFRPTNRADRDIVKAITGGPLSVRLGSSPDEAASNPVWLQILAERRRIDAAEPGTVAELCDRARRDYLPTIANEETRAWRTRHVAELERVFGARKYAKNVYDATRAAPGTYLIAMDVQRYIDRNKAARHVAVNRAVQTWRIVWKEARRRWGLTEYNPCEGLEGNEERAREVLPDDRAHFFKAYRELDPSARFVLALARYYGRRRGEALRIDMTGIDEIGVHTVRGKRARQLILAWDDDARVIVTRADGTRGPRPGRLRKMVARARRWRQAKLRPRLVAGEREITLGLLVNRLGGRLTPTGFNSAFRKAMERAGLVEELGEDAQGRRRTRRAFNPNDMRAKRASTLPRGIATEVLAHDEERTTETVYRRGPRVIKIREGM